MNNDILDYLNLLFEPGFKIIKTPVFEFNPDFGSEYSLMLNNGEIYASGTHKDNSIAIRICIAEALERKLSNKLMLTKFERDVFKLNEFPTTCGFACGFEDDKTKFRAIAEGIERWAWSKWIDSHFSLEEVNIDGKNFEKLTMSMLNEFKNFRVFFKSFDIIINNTIFKFYLNIFLGFSNTGIFPGSRVSLNQDSLDDISHSILEAYRCYRNYNLLESNQVDFQNTSDIIAERAVFFGSRQDLALEQISLSQTGNKTWEQPHILLLQKARTQLNGVYLWRCLMNDYIGWHQGEKNRFVY